MRKPMILLMLLVFAALPAAAQSNHEFGIVVGASTRNLQSTGTEDGAGAFLDDELNLSHNVIELSYGLKLDDQTWIKVKAGRIETPIRFTTREVANTDGTVTRFAKDEDGEVQHVSLVAEYRFSEPLGSSSIFAGIGAYRHSSDSAKSEADFGYQFGVNADFPMTRNYGFVVEGAYHWTRAPYNPKYLTVGGGVRFSF